MAENEIQVQEVHLTASNAKIGEEPVVVISIRPDLPSFRPHNLALPRSQAERLLEDLKTLLSRSIVLFLLPVLVGFSGCSGKVEVERETCSRPEAAAEVIFTDKTRTAVAIDLLRERGSVVMEDGESVDGPFDGVMVVRGCVHLHEHLHVYLSESDRKSERVALEVVREWTDGDCGRMRRE